MYNIWLSHWPPNRIKFEIFETATVLINKKTSLLSLVWPNITSDKIMEEIDDGKAKDIKKYPSPLYNRKHSKAVERFLNRTGKVMRFRNMNSGLNKRKKMWWSETNDNQRKQVIATCATVDGKEKESKSEHAQLKNPPMEILSPRIFTKECKFELIHEQTRETTAFAVAVPEIMTSVMKGFLYSEGGLMEPIDKRRFEIEKLLEDGSHDSPSQRVEMSPLMCQGQCTFVIDPFLLDTGNGKKKTPADMLSLIVSPKGFKDSQWMLGLLKHLRLDLFLENVNFAINQLNGTRNFKGTVLSQSILCTPYSFDRQKKVVREHIDGIPKTTPANNMYNVSVPLTLLEGSPPELHIFSEKKVFKYKFQLNEALGFSADQRHATACLTNSCWPSPNNMRVNMLLIIADQSYLEDKPEGYKEQILHMCDPCYPSSRLGMAEMLETSRSRSSYKEVALWKEKWNTYVNHYMEHSEKAHAYFQTCMETNAKTK